MFGGVPHFGIKMRVELSNSLFISLRHCVALFLGGVSAKRRGTAFSSK